jgi:hypothetical protein
MSSLIGYLDYRRLLHYWAALEIKGAYFIAIMASNTTYKQRPSTKNAGKAHVEVDAKGRNGPLCLLDTYAFCIEQLERKTQGQLILVWKTSANESLTFPQRFEGLSSVNW